MSSWSDPSSWPFGFAYGGGQDDGDDKRPDRRRSSSAPAKAYLESERDKMERLIRKAISESNGVPEKILMFVQDEHPDTHNNWRRLGSAEKTS